MKSVNSHFSLKNARKLSSLLILFLFAASCSDDEEPRVVKLTPNYCATTELNCAGLLSFHKGDYWIVDDGTKVEIGDEVEISGKKYFVVKLYEKDDKDKYVEVGNWKERIEGGKHLGLDEDGEETLIVDLSAEIGDHWVNPYFDPGDGMKEKGTYTTTLESKTASVTINGVTFNNAYVFGRVYSEYESAYIPLIYLPGLGLMRQENYQDGDLKPYFTFSVTECRINGTIYKVEP